MTTDTIPDTGLITTIDFGQTLKAMIAAGKYDWTNPDITASILVIQSPAGAKTFRNKLFHFGRDVSSENAVEAIKKEDFKPALHVQGLAFGAMFPDEQLKYPIACLGSSAQLHGYRCVVGLRRFCGRRGLDLYRWDGGWDTSWRFLGVQEVSGA